jgi:c-di-GMP-binding flagellar brake protein YcgR
VLVKVRVETSYRSDEFFCTSRNLSNTGILLETEKSLARGDTINCSFFLPDVERIRTDCLIIRIERAKEGKYTYGAEFIELDEHQSKQISEFISREREVGNII